MTEPFDPSDSASPLADQSEESAEEEMLAWQQRVIEYQAKMDLPLAYTAPDGTPVDVLTWATMKQSPNSRIGRARVHHALIFTDYVGEPLATYETQIFATRRRDKHTRWHFGILGRYNTLEEARAGHIANTQAVRARGLGAVGLTYARSRELTRMIRMVSVR